MNLAAWIAGWLVVLRGLARDSAELLWIGMTIVLLATIASGLRS